MGNVTALDSYSATTEIADIFGCKQPDSRNTLQVLEQFMVIVNVQSVRNIPHELQSTTSYEIVRIIIGAVNRRP